MNTTQTHYFRDEDDNSTVVVTEFRRGQYTAFVKEGENADVIAFGFGATRLEAIADLNHTLSLEWEP